MLSRNRDKKRFSKPAGHIPYEEWVDVTEKAEQAKRFKESFLYVIITHDLEEAKTKILTNAFDEIHTVYYTAASLTQNNGVLSFLPEQIRMIFTKPRKVSHDELVGQYKYMTAIIDEVESKIAEKEKMDKNEADGLIVIDREQNG